MTEPLIDSKAAAEQLGTTERHIRTLVQESRIGFVKVGRKVRFKQKDLDDYVKANSYRSKA